MEKVAIIGSGIMGSGIAQVATTCGFSACLYDNNPQALANAEKRIVKNLERGIEKGKLTASDKSQALAHLELCTSLQEAVTNSVVVIEAVPEVLELKQKLLTDVSKIVDQRTILASNTSSLSISKIAETVDCPERVVGMHFFNPPYAMKLLELVRGKETSDEITERALDFAKRMKRETIVVRDSPGFATSRLGVVLGLEAIRMVEQNVTTPESIDKAMELGYRHPMGPLRLTDLVGLDIRLGIADYLYEQFGEDQYKAPQLLRDMVAENKLGQKTGQGFYSWTN